jgi:hypothetical protein
VLEKVNKFQAIRDEVQSAMSKGIVVQESLSFMSGGATAGESIKDSLIDFASSTPLHTEYNADKLPAQVATSVVAVRLPTIDEASSRQESSALTTPKSSDPTVNQVDQVVPVEKSTSEVGSWLKSR